MQADTGFLDAYHVITVMELPAKLPAEKVNGGTARKKQLLLVEVAPPPPTRPSGVAGLNVEDFCGLNSSLRALQVFALRASIILALSPHPSLISPTSSPKTNAHGMFQRSMLRRMRCRFSPFHPCFCSRVRVLQRLLQASIGAMARKGGGAKPPLRDAKLTRMLANALGADSIRTHLLLCASQQRAHAQTSADLLTFGGMAMQARLRPNVYEASAPRAFCSQLQADLATIEAPSEETFAEIQEQMTPAPSQLQKLHERNAQLAQQLQTVDVQTQAVRSAFEHRQQQLMEAAEELEREQEQLAAENAELRSQVHAVRSGRDIEAAITALCEADARELSSLNRRVLAMQERLAAAKQEQARLAPSGGSGAASLPETSHALVQLGRHYTDNDMLPQAMAVLKASLACADVACGSGHRQVVAPLAALADLHIKAERAEEAINLLKRAYIIDKEALGPDAPEVGRHLIGLGTAYHAQGKLEAAALTLEEARSILVYSLGPNHSSVALVKDKIKKLSVIEVNIKQQPGSGAATPRTASRQEFEQRMEARLREKQKKASQLNLEGISRKQTEAELRRNGLLSARGSKAGEHFVHSGEVAVRVISEQERRATGERREHLLKKKALFRERLNRRRAEVDDWQGEDDEGEEESDDEGEDSAETMAAVESELFELLGRSTRAAQTEDWDEVVECATQVEGLICSLRNRAAGAGLALRVLRSGLKLVNSDEGRARSALAVLMMLEWCVPVCDDAFRQGLAGERWMRRMVELARKDSTEKGLVRSTVLQLIVSWAEW